MPGTRALAYLQTQVWQLIDGPLRGKFLPPALAQAFSSRPHELLKWTKPAARRPTSIDARHLATLHLRLQA